MCLGSISGDFDDREREKSSVHVHIQHHHQLPVEVLQVFFSLVTLAPGQHFPLEGFFADALC